MQPRRSRQLALLTLVSALALTPPVLASSHLTAEGEVRKVDRDAAKITLRHGEIRNLDMPPMTMVFQVQDKALLDKVKAGDKVRFAAEKVGGQYTLTAIEAQR